MKNMRFLLHMITGLLMVLFCNSCESGKDLKEGDVSAGAGDFYIGWSSADITPERPVLIRGQFHARISEGIMDPIMVTALAMESGSGSDSEKAIMISCDLARIGNDLVVEVRARLKEALPVIPSEKIVINATHTHSSVESGNHTDSKSIYGIDLDVMPPSECLDYIAEGIVKAAVEAWENRSPGGISYGLGHAVVGHQRIQVDMSGRSLMYGSINRPEFSHMEGFEDHSVKLLYTWDDTGRLTGVVINIVAPSQVSEQIYQISADFWHDTRVELGQRLGDDIYILTQSSPGGGKSPHVMIETRAEERMQRLMFPDDQSGRGSIGRRKQIAVRIADAVTSVLPYMKDNIDWDPVFAHRMKVVNLPRRLIPVEEVNEALLESAEWKEQYNKLFQEIHDNPEIRNKPRWYTDISRAYRRMERGQNVKQRYELEKIQPELPAEIHVVRIGDIVIATNSFEMYLDFGTRIIGRSPAILTFLVQFANGATNSDGYLPPYRAVAGGAYGAVPASGQVGPEGGQILVDRTVQMINDLFTNNN